MKKLFALLLAATTAISMFAGISVSALFSFDLYSESDAYLDAYQAATVRMTEQKIVITQPQHETVANPITTEVATVEDLIEFVEHLSFEEPTGTPVIFEALKELKDDPNMKYGIIYMYDYALDLDPVEDRTYAKALEKFDEMVEELLRTTPEKTEITVADFYDAWAKAYHIQPAKGISNISVGREQVIDRVKADGAEVLEYMTYASNAVTRIPDSSMFDHIDYEDYNMYTLTQDVYDIARSNTTISSAKTSELLYLANEWDRVLSEIRPADHSALEETYNETYYTVSKYKESDFTADNWAKVQENLAEAEKLAATANDTKTWTAANNAINAAAAVKGIAVKYTDLQKALMSLYADEKGDSKYDYILKEYTGKASDHCLYNEADFRVRPEGNQYVYSNEWTEFAINYYTTNTNTIKVIDEYSAYTWVYKLWEDIKKSNTSHKQSEVDEALERLNTAIDQLTPTQGSVAEWRLVMLQNYVDKANALNEDDFITTGKKWTTLQNAIADAENTLRKTNPSDSELNVVTMLLENALKDMLANAKAVPSNMKQELKDLINKADKLVTNVTTQSGAQVVALRNAAEDGAEVYEEIDANDNYNNPEKATISEVQAAIDDLKAAIENFNKPSGWIEVDDKWYYGDYADGWYKIGETWFMFNADGSMKESEWFQVNGKWYWANENGGLAVGWAKVDGKWYFFNQGNAMMTGWVKSNGSWYYLTASGAMATNTTIDGYKVNENGVWVA